MIITDRILLLRRGALMSVIGDSCLLRHKCASKGARNIILATRTPERAEGMDLVLGEDS